MSRTDVHRPGWVQERDPHNRRHFVADHNHTIHEAWDPQQRRWLVRRAVDCDLHAFLAAKGWAPTRCRMRYIGGRNIYCGCDMCTGRHWQRLARRRERHQWRRTAREILATVDRTDIDVPPIRAKD